MSDLMEPRQDDRRLVRGRRFGFRRVTAPLRKLPDFHVLGAMKCGTSSLFDYICQHPGVAPPFRKETHFYTKGWREGRTRNWYLAHFPLRPLSGGKLTGEATPDYLFETDALDRLSELHPRTKAIVILRDPVERAVSQYWHEVRMKRETLPLEDAIGLEEKRLEIAEDAGPAGLETLLHASYKRRGQYADQLERLFDRFPRQQVHILWSTDLFDRPQETMIDVFAFLDLPPDTEGMTFGVKNAGSSRKSVPADVVAALRSHFRTHDARLAELLDRPLPW